MEIVFIRHGKAETRSDAKADFERELTSLGRKKMKQAARGLAGSLLKGRVVQIWTSPTVRTMQTAEILQAAFGKKTVLQVKDLIVEGNLSELRAEWSKIPPLDVLIIVGHEPTMSEWTEKLSDSAFVFRPGSAASIILTDQEQTIGSLSWFMRVGVMARLSLSPGSQGRQNAKL